MKVKLTYPVPGHQAQVGHVVDVDPQKAKVWLKNDWCVEVIDEDPKLPKVKHEPKSAEQR